MRRLAVSSFACALAFAAACGSSSATNDGDATTIAAAGSGTSGGGSSGTGGTSSGGAGGGSPSACPSSGCPGGQTCSTLGHCIPTGTCETAADCGTDLVCDPMSKTCATPTGCGSQKIAAARVPSNLLVVLDRSCSMTAVVSGGTKTKWQIAEAAIDALTTKYKDGIRFGLTMFPLRTGPKCDATMEPIPVPIGDDNGAKIASILMAAQATTDPNYPSGPCVTPIDSGLKQASEDPALGDGVHPSYLLLVTDGEQYGCTVFGGATGAQTIAADLLKNETVGTFVVGFGSGVSKTELDAIAKAGGEPASGTHQFYSAQDEASLEAAFDAIAGKAIGCVFDLQSKPPDPSMLYVFFDDVSVMRDASHMNGWDYDAAKNRVTAYGAACDQLKSGSVGNVDIVFGCDQPPPH